MSSSLDSRSICAAVGPCGQRSSQLPGSVIHAGALTCLIATVSPVNLSMPLYTTPKLPPADGQLGRKSIKLGAPVVATHVRAPPAPGSGLRRPRLPLSASASSSGDSEIRAWWAEIYSCILQKVVETTRRGGGPVGCYHWSRGQTRTGSSRAEGRAADRG